MHRLHTVINQDHTHTYVPCAHDKHCRPLLVLPGRPHVLRHANRLALRMPAPSCCCGLSPKWQSEECKWILWGRNCLCGRPAIPFDRSIQSIDEYTPHPTLCGSTTGHSKSHDRGGGARTKGGTSTLLQEEEDGRPLYSILLLVLGYEERRIHTYSRRRFIPFRLPFIPDPLVHHNTTPRPHRADTPIARRNASTTPAAAASAAMQCQVCEQQPSKYKCPGCALRYCSVACCQAHKAAPCPGPNAAARVSGTTGPSPRSRANDHSRKRGREVRTCWLSTHASWNVKH